MRSTHNRTPKHTNEIRIKITREQNILFEGQAAAGEYRYRADAIRAAITAGLLSQGIGLAEQGLLGAGR